MLIIDSTATMARALDSPLPPALKQLLILRRDQLLTDGINLNELAAFTIIEPGDPPDAVLDALGFDLIEDDPSWEWVIDHDGLFEAASILTDDGFAHVLIVPDIKDIDPTLRSLLREHAVGHAVNSPANQA